VSRPNDRKALTRAYKETARPMGVFRVRNTAEGRSFVGSSSDLPAMLNRLSFQLRNGLNRTPELQADWNRLGAGAFTFETLDELEPRAEPGFDPAAELAELEQLWRERLRESGEGTY